MVYDRLLRHLGKYCSRIKLWFCVYWKIKVGWRYWCTRWCVHFLGGGWPCSICVCVCARVEVKNLKLILVVFLRRRCRVCFSIERFQHQLCMLTEKNWWKATISLELQLINLRRTNFKHTDGKMKTKRWNYEEKRRIEYCPLLINKKR